MTTEKLATHLANLVPAHRLHDVAERVMTSGLVVSTDDCNKWVNAEIDAASRQMRRAEVAERRTRELQQLLDLTSVERAEAVLNTLAKVPAQRTAKHSPDCWQRHTGCLANRIRHLLDGREVQ